MKIILITDAWEPQTNGVVRTLKYTSDLLEQNGHNVEVIHSGLFETFRCPLTYDVDLAKYVPHSFLKQKITPPCAVHIATEGPLGLITSRFCNQNEIPYTTAYHTNFPEYMWRHLWVPKPLTIRYIRWFHKHSKTVMVATPTLVNKLQKWNFHAPISIWSRGVDLKLFHPRPKYIKRERPLALYVGRVSKEKNIEAFLQISNDVEKYVVGDGPDLPRLIKKYPEVKFTGMLYGETLAQIYSEADVFCFPSLTDTFGLVVVEALASETPVAAYPVEGPQDIIGNHPQVGCLSENLEDAVQIALEKGEPTECRKLAEKFSWDFTTEQFLNNLVPFT